MMTNKAGMFLIAVVGLVVVLGCGKLTELVKEAANDSNANQLKRSDPAAREWKRFDLADTDISVETPGKPGDRSSPMFGIYREVFSAMHVYSYDEKDFTVGMTELVPTGKRKFTIKELADTSMAAAKKQAPDLTYTLDIQSDTKARYNGSFTRKSRTFEVRGCCIYQKTDPKRVWAVVAIYAADSADAQAASQRIIESASFKGSSEECE
jgi:hypothetical protein